MEYAQLGVLGNIGKIMEYAQLGVWGNIPWKYDKLFIDENKTD